MAQSLEQVIQQADSPLEMLRSSPIGSFTFPIVPDVQTNWIEEQRAWRETVALADQSYHMTGLTVEGPDALQTFSDLGIGNYTEFGVGRQHIHALTSLFYPSSPNDIAPRAYNHPEPTPGLSVNPLYFQQILVGLNGPKSRNCCRLPA